jgi:hypothetical protein
MPVKRRRSTKGPAARDARRRREARFVRSVLAQLEADLSAGRLSEPSELHERSMAAITAALTQGPRHDPYRISKLVGRVVGRAVPPLVEMLVDGAQSTAEQRLDEDAGQRLRFERRLHYRWGAALDALSLLRVWSLEAGIAFHRRHKPAEGDWVHVVLVRLHARACLIAAEVLVLLQAGLASGAHARWRSAHEIAVVGIFIAQHGQDAAERYLLHDAIESDRAVADYQRYATRLRQVPLSREDVSDVRTARDGLIARFGREYGSPYGWASVALNNPRPTFRDIEESASLDHVRPYYRMASHPTHAGPKGIAFDLGLLRDVAILAGPSNAGLADAGHAIAISLLNSTVTLLASDPDTGDIVTMTFLRGACDVVGEAFLRAHRQLEADDAASQDDSNA